MKLLNISYKDHITNVEVRNKIQEAIVKFYELPALVKKRKLRWFGHVSRSSGVQNNPIRPIFKFIPDFCLVYPYNLQVSVNCDKKTGLSVIMQPNKLNDLDKIHTVGRGLLQ